ncbi:TetR/AcrR family transcriptional regulator [Arcobacter arenosus]|uniref:TetR/AcrR family transcriptional regulator n=1 Tax=Arcobacter arenosus TaxID=2576037 RepID=A0A5R8Y3I4_9BACT|nr:TetR/AcrR family transcriptional regulator [Arcobacter arenosus]TLP40669.1 TetR/AcrR family transcriptional regulator [Arcobacter arenosus]
MIKYTMEKKKISTIDKIKNTALKLFNENDTLSISTNHIAKAAAISPGNLYYHFKNKEEIILSLYIDLSQIYSSQKSFEMIRISSNPIKQLQLNFDKMGELFYEYRFLLRDSMVIMALNPSLKELFVKNQQKRILQIQDILEFFVNENILVSSIKQHLEKRARLHWFITSYWQVFASTTGDVTKESIKEAKEVFFEFMIYPYLTTKGKNLLNVIE